MAENQEKNEESKVLYPKTLRSLAAHEIEEMKELTWSESALRALGNPKLDSLPLHQRYAEYILSTDGLRDDILQEGVVLPGNSIVHLYSPQGQMNIGWPLPVDASGRFTDGSIQQAGGFQLGPGFPLQGCNKFCILVRPGRAGYLINPRIPNWGASIGSMRTYWSHDDYFWQIGANDGDTCLVAFNDDWDRDNSGHLTIRLRVTPVKDFLAMFTNLIKVVKDKVE